MGVPGAPRPSREATGASAAEPMRGRRLESALILRASRARSREPAAVVWCNVPVVGSAGRGVLPQFADMRHRATAEAQTKAACFPEASLARSRAPRHAVPRFDRAK